MVVEAVRERLPLLLEYLGEEMATRKHVEDLYAYETAPVHLERQLLLKEMVREHLGTIFSVQEIEDGRIDWECGWVINIFDHHVPLNHAFSLGTNILSGFPEIGREEPKGLVVLSDSGVPLNNVLFNRGFSFRDHRIPLFTNRNRHRVVFGTGLIEEFPKIELPDAPSEMRALSEVVEAVHALIEAAVDFPGLSGFPDQVSRINHRFWPTLFAESLRPRVPAFFHASHESVANRMLLKYLTDPTHLFTRILCDTSLREKVLETFDGISGCWDLAAGHGTDFFWGLDSEGAAVRLTLEGDALVNRDCGIRVALESEALREAIRNARVYPGMFLVYGMTHFHCGVRPLGGIASVNYLTAMKAAWIRLLQEEDPPEGRLVSRVDTRGCIGGPILAWKRNGTTTDPMFALEVVSRGGFDEAYLEQLGPRTFGSLIKPALLTVFADFLKDERRESLTITPEDVAGEDGLAIFE